MSGQTTVIKSQKTELNQTIEELELALKAKEEVCSQTCSSTSSTICNNHNISSTTVCCVSKFRLFPASLIICYIFRVTTAGKGFDPKMYFLSNCLQELERLKTEVECANEFQSLKDSLTQKLQVSEATRGQILHSTTCWWSFCLVA